MPWVFTDIPEGPEICVDEEEWVAVRDRPDSPGGARPGGGEVTDGLRAAVRFAAKAAVLFEEVLKEGDHGVRRVDSLLAVEGRLCELKAVETGEGSRPVPDAEGPQALWPTRDGFESVLELCAFEGGRGKEVIEVAGSLGQKVVEG